MYNYTRLVQIDRGAGIGFTVRGHIILFFLSSCNRSFGASILYRDGRKEEYCAVVYGRS